MEKQYLWYYFYFTFLNQFKPVELKTSAHVIADTQNSNNHIITLKEKAKKTMLCKIILIMKCLLTVGQSRIRNVHPFLPLPAKTFSCSNVSFLNSHSQVLVLISRLPCFVSIQALENFNKGLKGKHVSFKAWSWEWPPQDRWSEFAFSADSIVKIAATTCQNSPTFNPAHNLRRPLRTFTQHRADEPQDELEDRCLFSLLVRQRWHLNLSHISRFGAIKHTWARETICKRRNFETR